MVIHQLHNSNRLKLTEMATKKVFRLRPLSDWLLTDEEWWDQA